MKISQEVKDYANKLNDKSQGMAQMSEKYKEMGSHLYVDINQQSEDTKGPVS